MRMASIGDNVVDRYEQFGVMYPGGGAANVAVHARRAGWDAAYIGVIGEVVADAMRAEGVDLSLAIFAPESNAITDVTIDDEGNRRFSGWAPPVARIELTPQLRAGIDGAQWIYTGYASRTEHLVPELGKLAPLAFDFSYRDEDYADPLLPHVSIAAFSREGLSDVEAIRLISRVQKRGPRTVVVTQGARGAVVAVGDIVHSQRALPTNPVDTLGAGDAFLARLVCGLEEREPLEVATAAAASAARAVCQHRGAFGHASPFAAQHAEESRHGV